MRKDIKAIFIIIILICSVFGFADKAKCAGAVPDETIKPQQYNILFILIDTLRPDHLGCYGYARNTSLNIDKFAQNSILFTNCYSVCPWTNPTVASIFTGRYPGAVFEPMGVRRAKYQILPDELETLAEKLQSSGFKTVCLTAHPALNKGVGYGQGFEEFIILSNEDHSEVDRKFTKEIFSKELDKVKDSKFFMYVHLMYPHKPYTPPQPYDTMFITEPGERTDRQAGDFLNAYDGEIRYTDDLMGDFFGKMKKEGLLESTYIIITADHGEGFWEHGLTEHGNSLYNELLKVPLIIYPPNGRTTQPARVTAPVSNIDMFATVMDMAQIKKPSYAEGMSLLRYFDEKYVSKKDTLLFSQNPHTNCIHALSCTDGNLKVICDPEKENDLFYDISSDPDEQKKLASPSKEHKKLKQKLMRFKRQIEKQRKPIAQNYCKPDKFLAERLKSLGYL